MTNAIILPHAIRFNAPATGSRPSLIVDALGAGTPNSGQSPADAAADLIAQFFSELGLPASLSSVGVTSDALAPIAEDAMLDWFLHQNPRKITNSAELVQLLRQAL